jgi:N-acetyltransferase
MQKTDLILEGSHVRLEPLGHHHVDGLLAAAAADPSFYRWTIVPQTKDAMLRYIDTALAWRDAGTAVPFATLRVRDGAVIGSTRLYDFETWAWPEGHERHGRALPDVCEIGWTWLTGPAIRTAANTEAKLLMMAHAFEQWDVLRVCFHTDARNERSRAALERIGGRPEGILRAHRLASDITIRDSARYSIVAAEWPTVKQNLLRALDRP